MANQTRNNSASESRHETDINRPHPSLSSSTKARLAEKNDDLIVVLSDAYENRRARQVGEWERLYGHNVYRGV